MPIEGIKGNKRNDKGVSEYEIHTEGKLIESLKATTIAPERPRVMNQPVVIAARSDTRMYVCTVFLRCHLSIKTKIWCNACLQMIIGAALRQVVDKKH